MKSAKFNKEFNGWEISHYDIQESKMNIILFTGNTELAALYNAIESLNDDLRDIDKENIRLEKLLNQIKKLVS